MVCEKGFEANEEILTCVEGSLEWDPKPSNPLSCNAVTCGKPPDLSGSKLNMENDTVGSIA